LEMANHSIFYDDRAGLFNELDGVCNSKINAFYGFRFVETK
jgi:hypothetical protein